MKRGSISILVLVFGIVFSVTIGGLVSLSSLLWSNSQRTEVYERALYIAEAGTDYYRWHLAHAPTDFKDGTAVNGPYVHQMTDPYGNTTGTFSLTIDPPPYGSTIVTITSTGWLNDNPSIKRTIKTRYGAPSIAKYSFLQNSNVWYGQKITIHGKVFSNGGIRMDGTHDSTVQSAKATYTCGSETGCSPSTTKPGVWGEGGPESLWQFPVPAVDFNAVALDFSTMKTAAQQTGVYLGASGAGGYHVTFNADGTYTVTKVTQTNTVKGWSVENGCENLAQIITQETLIGTYSIAQKGLFFAEDHVWVEGVVNGKATVVAAKFPLDVNKMNIWIRDNITYLAKDGSSNLGLIAQNSIIFALDLPQDFEIDAALFAQKGNVMRHNYKYQGCSMKSNAVRQTLTIYGSLISNLKSYWSFGQGGAGFGSEPTSGFSQREIFYDPTLYYTPPPYFPSQGQYELINWTEQ
jgi:hypothetical protein